MIDSLAATLALGGLVTAAVVIFRQRRSWRLVGVLEAGLAVQAAVAVARLFGGHRPGEPGPFVAYLTVSVLVLPVIALQVRADDSRWATALVAIGALVVAVVVVRAQTTWRG